MTKLQKKIKRIFTEPTDTEQAAIMSFLLGGWWIGLVRFG